MIRRQHCFNIEHDDSLNNESHGPVTLLETHDSSTEIQDRYGIW